MKGYPLALLSVILVSVAQVLLRQGSDIVPDLLQITPPVSVLLSPSGLKLLSGAGLYLLSAGCWFLALKRLQLSHAGALLSLSYLLVPLLARLSGTESISFTPGVIGGMILVIGGVILVCGPSPGSADHRS